MGSVLLDALSVLEAEITPATGAITGDLGYGSDLYCDGDATDDFRELPGSDPLLVVQAILRRVTTPRGTLLDDSGYGEDVARMLHQGMTPADKKASADMLSAEVLEDDRVLSCTVELTAIPQGLNVRIRGELADGKGPYSLTMVASGEATLLVEMHAND